MAGRRRKPLAGAEVELPITPMLDMAFQLLTFFIFTYRPSSFEGLIDLALPTDAEARAAKPADAKPQDSDPIDLPARVTVMIRTPVAREGEGKPSGYVVIDEDAQSQSPLLLDLAELEKHLRALRPKLGDNAGEVKIKADGWLKFEHVVAVMDVCTHPAKGGFRHVGFALGRPKAGLPAR